MAAAMAVDHPWTAEELAAYKATKELLLSRGMARDKISTRDLFITVINCKLRPEKAADKYTALLEILQKDFGFTGFDEVWRDIGAAGDGSEEAWQSLIPEMAYAAWYESLTHSFFIWPLVHINPRD
jgi:hypothetical protein